MTANSSEDSVKQSNGIAIGLSIGALFILGFLAILLFGSLKKTKTKEEQNVRRINSGKYYWH